MMTLFASSPSQNNKSDLNNIAKPACAERVGLVIVAHGKYFLSSALLIFVEEHPRNTLKDTKVLTVPAIRTGQGPKQIGISTGPDPDGWET